MLLGDVPSEKPVASPRDIKSFNNESVFVGGKLKQCDSDWWIEIPDKVPSHELMQKPSTCESLPADFSWSFCACREGRNQARIALRKTQRPRQ